MRISWKPFLRQMPGELIRDRALIFSEDPHLLQKVFAMPKKKALKLHDAYNLFSIEVVGELSKKNGDASLLLKMIKDEVHWTSWISEQGYHITFSGEEYEIQTPSS